MSEFYPENRRLCQSFRHDLCLRIRPGECHFGWISVVLSQLLDASGKTFRVLRLLAICRSQSMAKHESSLSVFTFIKPGQAYSLRQGRESYLNGGHSEYRPMECDIPLHLTKSY